jgi:hypothetical protein
MVISNATKAKETKNNSMTFGGSSRSIFQVPFLLRFWGDRNFKELQLGRSLFVAKHGQLYRRRWNEAKLPGML